MIETKFARIGVGALGRQSVLLKLAPFDSDHYFLIGGSDGIQTAVMHTDIRDSNPSGGNNCIIHEMEMARTRTIHNDEIYYVKITGDFTSEMDFRVRDPIIHGLFKNSLDGTKIVEFFNFEYNPAIGPFVKKKKTDQLKKEQTGFARRKRSMENG